MNNTSTDTVGASPQAMSVRFNIVETAFLTQSDANFVAHVSAYDPLLFETVRRFGTAGGPDTVTLTERGWEKAYSLACSTRFQLKSLHIRVLETLAASGEDGLSTKELGRHEYSAANALDFAIHDENAQHCLAAGLRGDEEAYARIRDRNKLIWVDTSALPPRFKVTSLGREFITAAHIVADEFVAKFGTAVLDAASKPSDNNPMR